MKVGIIILCRYNSTRLPGKILREINGSTILELIVEKIKRVAPNYPIVVATSISKSDDPIFEHCHKLRVPCFRGELDDVADRFLKCSEFYSWDYAVRINGDNLFVDSETLLEMLAISKLNIFDLVTNVPGRTFPFGMSIEIIKTSFFREFINEMQDAKYREHVTLYFYDNPQLGNTYTHVNEKYPQAAGLNFAIDTENDFEKASKIAKYFEGVLINKGLREICDALSAINTTSPWSTSSYPLLISEIGGNHEGDFEVAKAMTKLAIECGSHCVKFQLYTGNTLVSPVESPTRNKHFKKFELTKDQHIFLAKMCRDANVIYAASVWDLEMLEWIDPYLEFYKIGSGDLTAWPILEAFAKRGKPMLLSVGLSELDEILQTVEFIQSINTVYKSSKMLCILQCTSMYPIPDADANLKVMETIKSRTGLSVGYSDHTVGMDALKIAVAMGASVLEYHFTDNREGRDFRDHQVSLLPHEVSELKNEIRKILEIKGNGIKKPEKSELDNGHVTSFRRACYLNKTLKVGQAITENDLVFLRPMHGTDAREYRSVIGSKVLKDIEPYASIQRDIDFS